MAVTVLARCQGTSRRMITGTTMLPIMIAVPMTTVPRNTVAVGPADRTMVPTSTPNRPGPPCSCSRAISGSSAQ